MRMQRPTGASVTMALSCEDGARCLGGQSGVYEVYEVYGVHTFPLAFFNTREAGALEDQPDSHPPPPRGEPSKL